MPMVRVTDRVRQLIRANAEDGKTFRQTGAQRPDGDWDIPVDDEVMARLEAVRLSGETDNDCIERLCSTQRGTN